MFNLKLFFSNFRYNQSTRIKTALVILCIITWGLAGGAVFWLLNTPNQPALVTDNKTAPSQTAVTPGEQPPLISDISVVDISDSSACIVWRTDTPATSIVEYWIEGSSEKATKENSSLQLNHRIELSGLKNKTKYSFLVKSSSGAGMETVSRMPGTFATGAVVSLESPEVGYTAPDFTLTATSSDNVTLSDKRGKWVILVFWETTCSACREELPDLQAYSKRMQADRIEIITVNVRNANERILGSFLQSRDITLPVLLDPDGVVRDRYKIVQYPTAFFIDTNGIIRMVYDHRFDNVDQIAMTIVSLIGN